MARFRNSNRTLKHIVRSPNLLRKILVPLDQAIRQAISLKKEKSWFPKFPVLAHILCGIFFHIAQLHSLRDLLETLNQKLNSKLLHGFDLKRSTTADSNNSPRRLKVIRRMYSVMTYVFSDQVFDFRVNEVRAARLTPETGSFRLVILGPVDSHSWVVEAFQMGAGKVAVGRLS